LTKLDGDARGGAALSLKAVTQKPIKFAGVGEKLEDFDAFHPERMASRILGMGDVVSLVERAAEAVDEADAKRLEEKMRKGLFTLEDFLEQLRQMKKLGPSKASSACCRAARDAQTAGRPEQTGEGIPAHGGNHLRHDPAGTRFPQVLNAKRRQRIARGSGVQVSAVNDVLNKFNQMQQMMKKFGKFQKMMMRMGSAGGMMGR
jgi:signal recognition particle subunit SRP54